MTTVVTGTTGFLGNTLVEAAKLEGELLALKAYQEQGLPVTVVRPGLVYGSDDLRLLGLFVSIKSCIYDISRAKSELGYALKFELEECMQLKVV